jgi:flagellar secretion chaperone FliS
MMGNPYASYRKIATETADPMELVIMLYRGAINFLNTAERSMLAGDVAPAHTALVRAQEIVAELMGTLNLDAGDVARNLHRLYDFMQQRLIEANIQKDVAITSEVRAMLTDLLLTWDEIARNARAATTPRREMAAAFAVA